MNSDRRKHPRYRANIPATLVWNDGLSRASGLILDHSEQGAMVRLQNGERIGGDCYILFQHRIEPCRLVWQASQSIGLLFLEGNQLAAG